tara:strand:- start:20 stop:418 length:399 start_codon:yes stop_codon:yes gene_type:complete
MKLKRNKVSDYDDDSLLPLVNIIFLLLIFFMIAGVIEKRIIKDDIELPNAELSRFEHRQVTKIFINKNNSLFIDDEIISRNQIDSFFSSRENIEVVIIADKNLLIKDISFLLNKLHKNNITNIKLLSNNNAN